MQRAGADALAGLAELRAAGSMVDMRVSAKASRRL